MYRRQVSIVQALHEIDSSRGWSARGNTYDDVIWDDIELSERPPREEVEAKLQELIDAQPWKELREERNRRLAQCDWVAIRATTTETTVPEEWKTYMQALRDLPTNTTDPENPVWPEAPIL